MPAQLRAPTNTDGTAPVLPPGSKAGRFEIIRALSDDSGVVQYEAHDPELDRSVQLEVISPLARGTLPNLDSALIERYRALASVSHPNVAAVYDVQRLGAALCLATEAVAGQPIHRWLAQVRPTPEQVVDIFCQIAHGLAAAHNANAVHGMLRPEAILVRADGVARLAGFDLGQRPLGDSGAARYRAPELAAGERSPAGDQFALCALLREALLEAVAAPAHETSRAGDESRIPGRLRAILSRGLSANPADRLPSASDLAAALSRRSQLARRFTAALTIALAAAGAFAVYRGVAMALDTPSGSPEQPACTRSRDHLRGSWDDAERQRVRAAMVRAEVPTSEVQFNLVAAALDRYAGGWTRAHEQICAATRSGKQSAGALDVRMHCLESARLRMAALTALLATPKGPTESALDAVAGLPAPSICATSETLAARLPIPVDAATRTRTARLRREIASAEAQRLAGRFARAGELLTGLENEIAALDYAPLEAEWLFASALALKGADGDPAVVEERLRRAALSAQAGRHDEAAARAWLALMAFASQQQRDPALAGEYEANARAAVERLASPPALAAELHYQIAARLVDLGNFDRAMEEFTTARETWGRAGDQGGVLSALEGIGVIYDSRGNFAQALAVHQDLLDKRRSQLGELHPDVARSHTNIASALLQSGDMEGGASHLRRSFEIYRAVHGPDNLATAVAAMNLGDALSVIGRAEEGLQYLGKARHVFEAQQAPDSLNLAEVSIRETMALLQLGQAQLAVDAARRALLGYRKHLPDPHPSTAHAIEMLGEALRKNGQPELAREQYEAGLAAVEAAYGRQHSYYPLALTELSMALIDLHEELQAIEQQERALAIYATGMEADPAEVALARWTLARALGAAGRQRRRSLELARQARETLAEDTERWRADVEQIDAWLHERAGKH